MTTAVERFVVGFNVVVGVLLVGAFVRMAIDRWKDRRDRRGRPV